jgi:hypothetical protein
MGGLPMKAATSTEFGRANTSAGAPDLLDLAVHEHRHAVGERHRLLLVVRHVDGGDPERALQLLELDPGLEAQLGVEVRQGLVEEEQPSLAHDGPRECTALLLPSGELARLTIEQMLDLHLARRFLDAPGISAFGSFAISSGKAMFWNTVICG